MKNSNAPVLVEANGANFAFVANGANGVEVMGNGADNANGIVEVPELL